MENTYQDGDNYVCPDCAHEWPMAAPGQKKAKPTRSSPTRTAPRWPMVTRSS